MKKFAQKDLFEELLLFQKNHPTEGGEFKHNLNEQQRMENSYKMALYYQEGLAQLIDKYYCSGELPLFGNIMLSTVNRCNGNCTFCGANASREKRAYQYMSEQLFQKIIQECRDLDYSGRITMEGLNEPFVDKNMCDRIGYIHEKLSRARIHVITNGTLLTKDEFCKIYPMVEKIHINGYDNRGERQIEECLESAKKFADEGEHLKYTKRKSEEILSQFGENECGRTKHQRLPCSCIIPFNTLSILPNGKVNLCIADMENRFCLGDINSQSLTEIWYGEKADQYRRELVDGRKKVQLCCNCDMFCF